MYWTSNSASWTCSWWRVQHRRLRGPCVESRTWSSTLIRTWCDHTARYVCKTTVNRTKVARIHTSSETRNWVLWSKSATGDINIKLKEANQPKSTEIRLTGKTPYRKDRWSSASTARTWRRFAANVNIAFLLKTDMHRRVFCAAWPWPLTFYLKINEFPGLMVDHVCVKFGDPSCIGFRDIV